MEDDIAYVKLSVRAGNSFVKELEWEFDTSDGSPEPPSFIGTKFVFRGEFGEEEFEIATDDSSGDLTITGERSVKIHIPHTTTDDWPDGRLWACELEWWDGTDEFTLIDIDLAVSRRVNSNG